ncbi:MAG: hypothetical protein ACLRWQ_21520 [Flavonifractor plautii]
MKVTHVSLQVPGEHNVQQRPGRRRRRACALAVEPVRAVSGGPGRLPGAGRRFEHKGHTTGRRYMTTTPTTPVRPPLPWLAARTWAYERVICAFSPTPIPAPTPCSTTLWRRSARPTSPFWRRSTPPARSTTSASPPRIWRRASPAVSTMPRCPR